jgi:NAD(P)-dependent dehydrogenase (short-subunit alcohol dehydrogenase family)
MKNSVATVTGASQGIERFIAIRLARDFSAVVVPQVDLFEMKDEEWKPGWSEMVRSRASRAERDASSHPRHATSCLWHGDSSGRCVRVS